jgi:hypothetical protein
MVRLLVGLACLGYGGYQILLNRSGAVVVALGVGLILSAAWGARQQAAESRQVGDRRNNP